MKKFPTYVGLGKGFDMPKCRVLVVDDDTTFRDSLVEFLNAKDYEAYRAFDGIDALVKTFGGSPQFVIWALPRPEHWGFDFLTHIKRTQPSVLVIACSDDKSDERTFSANADRIFPKQHWTEGELLACLEELKSKHIPAA